MVEPRVRLELRILIPAGPKAFSRGESPASTPEPDPRALEAAISLAAAMGVGVGESFPWERQSVLPPAPPAADRFPALLGLSLLVAGGQGSEARALSKIRAEEIRLEEFSGRLLRRGGPAYMDWSRFAAPCLLLRSSEGRHMGEALEEFLLGVRDALSFLKLVPQGGFDEAVRCNAYLGLAESATGYAATGDGPADPFSSVKIRNLNSANFVRKAVNAELSRQEEVISSGGRVRPESRLWNEAENRTEPFRERLDEGRERYLDAGLEPFIPPSSLIEAARERALSLEPLRLERRLAEKGVPRHFARAISSNPARFAFLEACLGFGVDAGTAARLLCLETPRLERRELKALEHSGLSPERLASICRLLSQGRLHARMAKRLVEAVFTENEEPLAILEKRGWAPISEPAALAAVIEKALSANPGLGDLARGGDQGARDRLIGLAMRETGERADPQLVSEALRIRLPSREIRVFSGSRPDPGAAEKTGLSIAYLPWPQPKGKGDFASRWASVVCAIAQAVQRDGVRGVLACLPARGSASLAAFIAYTLGDSPAPIALLAEGDPDSPAYRADFLIAMDFADSGRAGVMVAGSGRLRSPLETDGDPGAVFSETPPLEPPLAPGAWEADEDIISSILRSAAGDSQALAMLPGSEDESSRALQAQAPKNLILEFADPGALAEESARPAYKTLFAGLRKRGILSIAAFRDRVASVRDQEGAISFLESEGLIFSGFHSLDLVFARLLAASLEAETREELKALIRGSP